MREQILVRELIPHRHNPDDLVPVIKMNPYFETDTLQQIIPEDIEERDWGEITLEQMDVIEPDTANMVRRIVVSVEQFTSFRGFSWCRTGQPA